MQIRSRLQTGYLATCNIITAEEQAQVIKEKIVCLHEDMGGTQLSLGQIERILRPLEVTQAVLEPGVAACRWHSPA